MSRIVEHALSNLRPTISIRCQQTDGSKVWQDITAPAIDDTTDEIIGRMFQEIEKMADLISLRHALGQVWCDHLMENGIVPALPEPKDGLGRAWMHFLHNKGLVWLADDLQEEI